MEAYIESPYKSGDVHLSAPSMYARVLEAIQLNPGNSCLVIGSGTGYFTCLASYLVGESGIVHGVEIKDSLIEYSRNRIAKWKSKVFNNEKKVSNHEISIIQGNAFGIDVIKAKRTCSYDRIYVAAGCPRSKLFYFLSLLKDDGILIAPIVDSNQMLSVHKICDRIYQEQTVCHCYFAPLLEVPVAAAEKATSRLYNLLFDEPGCMTLKETDLKSIDHKMKLATKTTELKIVPVRDCLFVEETSSFPSSAGSPTIPLTHRTTISTASTTMTVSLPPLIWTPARANHVKFPPEYHTIVMLLLLAQQTHHLPCNIDYHPPNKRAKLLEHDSSTTSHHNACARLPQAVWFHILSFCSRYL